MADGSGMQASLNLQRAIASAILADAAIGAAGLKIYDGPPAEARAPYLSFGADQVGARRWQGGVGFEHRFALSLWEARDGMAGVKEQLSQVERVVLAMPRQLSGMRITALRLVRGHVRRTQRNWTLGQLEFRALTVMED